MTHEFLRIETQFPESVYDTLLQKEITPTITVGSFITINDVVKCEITTRDGRTAPAIMFGVSKPGSHTNRICGMRKFINDETIEECFNHWPANVGEFCKEMVGRTFEVASIEMPADRMDTNFWYAKKVILRPA